MAGSLTVVLLRDFDKLGVLNEALVVLDDDDDDDDLADGCECESSGVEVMRVAAIGLLRATRSSMVSCSNCFKLTDTSNWSALDRAAGGTRDKEAGLTLG